MSEVWVVRIDMDDKIWLAGIYDSLEKADEAIERINALDVFSNDFVHVERFELNGNSKVEDYEKNYGGTF